MKTNQTLSRAGFALALSIFSLAGVGALSAASDWSEDFAAAKSTAAKEKKDLLIDFTGSDWCVWCKKLRKEVFDTPEFKKAGPKNFVLVELDYPQSKEQEGKIKEQNEKLREDYKIEGYPTILLTDAEGRPYAKTGYQEGGPEKYLQHLDELRAVRTKRDAGFAKAEKATGLEKAKALSEALKDLDDELVYQHYASVIDQLVAADPEDTLGFKKRMELNKADVELRNKLGALAQEEKFPEFLKTIDEFIATQKLEGESKQKYLLYKLSAYGPDKLDDAEKVVDAVLKIGGENETVDQAKMIKARIKELRSQVDKSKKDGDAKEDSAEEEKPAPKKGKGEASEEESGDKPAPKKKSADDGKQ